MKILSAAGALRLGFVGGGEASGIGPTHWYASRFDGNFSLVAGAFSADAQRNRSAGEAYGLAPERVYESFEHMALAESSRADGVEAVAIMLPNKQHVAATRAFLARGIDVICEKPLATSAAEAGTIMSDPTRSAPRKRSVERIERPKSRR